jgi:hypothetical protein
MLKKPGGKKTTQGVARQKKNTFEMSSGSTGEGASSTLRRGYSIPTTPASMKVGYSTSTSITRAKVRGAQHAIEIRINVMQQKKKNM